jgi:hypothetical protein
MSAKPQTVGIVRLNPSDWSRLAGPCDDSTLDVLLASLAHRQSLAEVPFRQSAWANRLATRRLNWPYSSEVDVSVIANAAQLAHDLQAEFDRLESTSL